jgi:UPF0755 protein
VKFKFAQVLNPLPLTVLLAVFLAGTGLTGSVLWWDWAVSPVQSKQVTNPPRQRLEGFAPQRLEVLPGQSADAVGEKLQAAGLIHSQLAWKLWVRWLKFQDPQSGPQVGTFALSPQDSLTAIADQLWQGKVLQTQFTIPEGWSMRQMGAYFQSQGLFSAADFTQAAQKLDRNLYPWLPADLTSLEGWLYPDTYQLPEGQVTPQAVIDLMLKQFATVALPLYRQHQAATKLSLKDWVILSSIVEKEAVIAKERPIIAAVFLNRLQQNISLGADPTVEYGLGVTQTPDRPLTLAQVQMPSPYNTYINLGLPPTAIASPGLASLEAVLRPQPTADLYFVARYDGTHVFSRTLAEHEAAQGRIHDQRDVQRSPSLPKR